MKKTLITLLHLGYWFIYLLLAMMITYMASSEEIEGDVDEELLFMAFVLVVLLPAIFTFYAFYRWLFTRFFARKQIGMAFLIGTGVSLGSSLIGFALLGLFFYPECVAQSELESTGPFIAIVSVFNLLGGTVAFVFKGFSNWFDEREAKENLLEKNHAMELALVKSQLDPHFLFNTINNIDVLILKDPAEASDYLNRLSDMMRFMLYETKTEQIPLKEELAYLEKYVALQKIRTSNKSYAEFTVIGSPQGRTIAPMLFIPFVENAFKHTTNKKAEGAINIQVTIDDEGISMSCINQLEPHRKQVAEAGGIGNELIRKRLDLLYPGRYQLDIYRDLSTYRVDLNLKARS